MMEQIFESVLAFIHNPETGLFDDLVLRVFDFQFHHNEPYRRYCERRGKTPRTVTAWKEVPAVPTAAFKEVDLCSGPMERVFVTSGTTQGAEKRGRHSFPKLELYHAAIKPNFATHLLPDGARLQMLILTPPPGVLPHSSLSHMMGVVMGEFGVEGSAYFADQNRLDVSSLARALSTTERVGQPVFLPGTTFAFVHLFDYCLEQGVQFRLPLGSRVMDTGGSKGRARELSRPEFYRLCSDFLGIPEAWCVNEYGMTEMGSQFYDNVLKNHHLGIIEPRYKLIPPWVRTVVVDPETFQEAPAGMLGLLRHYDLANWGSVMGIQTEDVGYRIGEGFEVVGRAKGAEARGCSLAMEELLRAL